MATAKKTAAKSAKPTAKKAVKKVVPSKLTTVKAKTKVVVKASKSVKPKPKAKAVKPAPKPVAKKAAAKAVKTAVKKVVKTPAKKVAKPAPKAVAKKIKIVAKPAPKAAKKAAAKLTKTPKQAAKIALPANPAKPTKPTKPIKPIKPIKPSKAIPKVTSKINAKLAPPQIDEPVHQSQEKPAKLSKAEKLSKATKAVAPATAPLVKGAKGAIAATTSAPPPTGGKMMTKNAQVVAAPAPPIAVVHAPVRALPKSMTVKAAVSNVLPFNPNTKRVDGMISEAEILKQTKDQYMSKVQLAFFKHRLSALASQLRENAGQTTEHLRELAIVPDPADRATLEEEHALELRARDRERKLLKKVEAAILRVDEGSYGYCDETGDPIGIPRLLARPTATLTIEAQERRELKQRMFGE